MTLLSNSIASPLSPNWTITTSNMNASSGNFILANTTGGPITITLPTTAGINAVINFSDPYGTWNTNNLTINGNGNNIAGSATPLIADVNGTSFYLYYVGGTIGWKFYAGNTNVPGQTGQTGLPGNASIPSNAVQGNLPAFSATTNAMVDSGVSLATVQAQLSTLQAQAAFAFCAGILF